MALYRFYKQMIIGTIFLLVLAGVSLWVWHASRPQASCFDGIKNQNEEAADCGGICALVCKKEPAYKVVSVLRSQFFKTSPSAYDVLGEVENKNTDFGSPSFGYEFALLDENGNTLVSRRGASYILPQEKKLIAAQHLETSKAAASARLTVFGEQWIEVGEFASTNLFIRSKELSTVLEGSSPSGYKASGVVVNQTGFDFEQADIVVVLKDSSDKEIGVGMSDVRTLSSGGQRYFEVRWPGLPGIWASRVDMDVYTNLLANQNFLVHYGKGQEKFQQEVPVPSKGIRK